MPTFEERITDRQARLSVRIALPDQPQAASDFTALIDTGAQETMITQRVADRIGAVAVGAKTVIYANGARVREPAYMVSIRARARSADDAQHVWSAYELLSDPETEVTRIPGGGGEFDALIGMDILERLHTTIFGGRVILRN